MTARYWKVSNSTTKSIVTFSGHEAAVWNVKQISDNRVITASADKTIGVWTPNGQRLNTLKGELIFFLNKILTKKHSFRTY